MSGETSHPRWAQAASRKFQYASAHYISGHFDVQLHDRTHTLSPRRITYEECWPPPHLPTQPEAHATRTHQKVCISARGQWMRVSSCESSGKGGHL